MFIYMFLTDCKIRQWCTVEFTPVQKLMKSTVFCKAAKSIGLAITEPICAKTSVKFGC